VVIEDHLDGSRVIRFGSHALNYREILPASALGALPPNPRSLALGGRCQCGQRRDNENGSGSPGGTRPAGIQRPPGARVALLRTPILPTARPTIPNRPDHVQRTITPGGNGRSTDPKERSATGHFYCGQIADISIVVGQRPVCHVDNAWRAR